MKASYPARHQQTKRMRPHRARRHWGIVRHIVWACAAALLYITAANAHATEGERILIEYVEPGQPAHRPLYDALKEHRVLERVRDLLSPVRWPQPLRLEVKGCDGDSNAWYADATVTFCYEYVEEIWTRADSAPRPAAITRDDAFVGPLLEVFLHEASHALFDMLKIPLLGREEDAADQLAAYYVLQLPHETKRNLILAGAWAHASELKVRRARDLHRPRLQVTRHITFADEHGTTAQRLYNLLCIAYGSDKQLFADVVEQGFLPQERADVCESEYQQVDFAYHALISPHIDSGR